MRLQYTSLPLLSQYFTAIDGQSNLNLVDALSDRAETLHAGDSKLRNRFIRTYYSSEKGVCLEFSSFSYQWKLVEVAMNDCLRLLVLSPMDDVITR